MTDTTTTSWMKMGTIVLCAIVGTAALTDLFWNIRYRGPSLKSVVAPANAGTTQATRAAATQTAAPAAPAVGAGPAPESRAQSEPRSSKTTPSKGALVRGRSARRLGVTIAGRPLEMYGIAWFLLVLVLALAPLLDADAVRDRFGFYLFCVSVAGVTAVIWSASHLSFDWRAASSRHLLAAGCVLIIFIVSLIARQPAFTTVAHSVVWDAKLLAGRAVTWMAVTAFVAINSLHAATPANPDAVPTGAAFERWYAAQARVQLPIDPEGAKVLIVKFNDFQCPPCKRTAAEYIPVIARLAREHPGAIRFVTLDYPLEQECNPYMQYDLHEASCEAAVVVRLARERGRGPAMEEWLWDHQASLTHDAVFEAARLVAGIQDLPQRYASVLGLVKADIETGHAFRVVGTPTHFVNGVRLPVLPVDDFETALRYELAAQERAGAASTQ
jgi:protein-disulfide isomerase